MRLCVNHDYHLINIMDEFVKYGKNNSQKITKTIYLRKSLESVDIYRFWEILKMQHNIGLCCKLGGER